MSDEEVDVFRFRTTIRRAIALIMLAASCGVVGTATASTAAVAASKNKVCANVTSGGQSYSVSATNVSCSFAQQWVGKLASQRLPSNAIRKTLSKGPSGYLCAAGTKTKSGVEHVAANVQISGNCAKGVGLGNSPYFNWSIRNVLD